MFLVKEALYMDTIRIIFIIPFRIVLQDKGKMSNLPIVFIFF